MTRFLLIALAAPAWLAAQCTFTVNPASANVVGTSDTTGSVNITASAGNCVRTVVSNDPDWLTVSFGTSGTGNGSFGWRAEANTTASARTGSISVGNARFNLTQGPGNCEFETSALGARVANTAGSGTFTIRTRCQWTATSGASWLRVSPASGTGDGTITYNYDANPSQDTRVGALTVAGRTFTVTQNGTGCTVRIDSTSATVPPAGGTGSIAVTSSCSWSASRTQTWITLTGATAGQGNGTVAYRVDANTGSTRRLGVINVQDQTFTISQDGSDLPALSAVVNAASFLGGAVSPGEIVVLFGQRFGAAPITTLALTPDNLFLTKSLAETRVLFDDVPAPMVYSFTGQVSAIVPYSVAGKQRVNVVVEQGGRRSPALGVEVMPTAPGVFTQSATGAGASAVLNEDFGLNTPVSPAGIGSIIQIFATGEGQTEPAGIDGKLTDASLPQAVAQVQVFVGGANAEILYRGGAPGLVAGLIQINARIPAASPKGDAVPLQVRMGGRNSQGNITISVQ